MFLDVFFSVRIIIITTSAEAPLALTPPWTRRRVFGFSAQSVGTVQMVSLLFLSSHWAHNCPLVPSLAGCRGSVLFFVFLLLLLLLFLGKVEADAHFERSSRYWHSASAPDLITMWMGDFDHLLRIPPIDVSAQMCPISKICTLGRKKLSLHRKPPFVLISGTWWSECWTLSLKVSCCAVTCRKSCGGYELRAESLIGQSIVI